MKTEHELNADILKVTMIIRDKYPELSKYISEMTITIPDVETPEINIKNLQEYYNSLVDILKKYAPSHISEI
ncbi:MAG: hypothetical protein H7339_16880 [Arcicella sp.]|nr:hypothetical protein [Arcicella sp.]